MRNTTIASLLMLLFVVAMIGSCKKEKAAQGIDKEMYDMAVATNGFTWYKNSQASLDKSPGSGHPQPFLRTRYNAIAATMLDADGKIKAGSMFPEGSFIVKELLENQNTIVRYAILYKKAGNEAADANGWVWGYVNADGTVAEPASKKGAICTGCHLQIDNIDYMLMNKYFP